MWHLILNQIIVTGSHSMALTWKKRFKSACLNSCPCNKSIWWLIISDLDQRLWWGVVGRILINVKLFFPAGQRRRLQTDFSRCRTNVKWSVLSHDANQINLNVRKRSYDSIILRQSHANVFGTGKRSTMERMNETYYGAVCSHILSTSSMHILNVKLTF